MKSTRMFLCALVSWNAGAAGTPQEAFAAGLTFQYDWQDTQGVHKYRALIGDSLVHHWLTQEIGPTILNHGAAGAKAPDICKMVKSHALSIVEPDPAKQSMYEWADVIGVLIGTNDAAYIRAGKETIQQYGAAVQCIVDNVRGTLVYFAIPPATYAPKNQTINQLNPIAQSICNAKGGAGINPCIWIEQPRELFLPDGSGNGDPQFYSDRAHFNTRGYVEILTPYAREAFRRAGIEP